MRRLLRLLAALFAVSLLLGNSNCSKNNASDAPQFVTTLQIENSSGQVSGGFSQGNTINLVLTIRNRSDTAQTLFFNSSEFANFAVVQAGTADVVWSCDGDAAGIAAATCTTTGSLTTSSGNGGFVQISLAAFQSRTITFTWTGLNNNGDQLAKGSYEVLGGFTVYNTAGAGSAADNGNSMAEGQPTASQMFPTVYRSILLPFTIQ